MASTTPLSLPATGPTFSNTEELVTFQVDEGEAMEMFMVYKEVACLYSPVLKAALNSGFLEGKKAEKKKKLKKPTLNNPQQLITIYAGQNPEAKPFVMHRDFASHFSPVLKVAFNSGFVEAQKQEYRVDEDDEEVVRLLMECDPEIYMSGHETLRKK